MRAHRLDGFRQQGVLLVAAGGWGCVLWLAIMGWLLHRPDLGWVLLVGATANVLPSLAAYRRRFDPDSRMIVGTLAAVHPALGVYLLSGHAWQIDWHMYFFVAMAALTVLCDWRPIVLAAVLIAAHHLALDRLAPHWIFSGGHELGRVAVHALAVILQAGALAFVTIRMRNLLVEQEQAQAASEEQARAAIDRSIELQAAIQRAEIASRAAEEANAREAAERERRERLERDSASLRQRDMFALAKDFEASISDLAGQVADALDRLGSSATVLGSSARRTTAATANVAVIADQSSTGAIDLARRLTELSQSVNAVAMSVDAQGRSSGEASDRAKFARLAVSDLQERTTRISAFALLIDELARKTNLLALNASIEAARSGDAGRGFAVVAGEVKGLAGQAQQATSSVQDLARLSNEGAETTKAALFEIAALVEQFAATAGSIRDEIGRQNETAGSIKEAAREAAAGASAIVKEMQTIAHVAEETAGLSSDVGGAVADLSRIATLLKDQTRRFTVQLRAA
ncbi:MAG TPA: methyl-accepting chemotaxis protein [Sphingomonas sp.]|nr:methyl-accepting chemotaxis protein [Sphingomonas sp.]